MERLIEGFLVFRETYYERHRPLFDALARGGQSPQAMIISCCDSRVDPGRIFSAGPGDIFVVRNVANLVPPYGPDDAYHGTSAALEFAVKTLQVEHIIVLGHARCGGIGALLDERAGGEFITPWMAIAHPARERAKELGQGQPPEAMQRICEQQTVLVSLGNLMTFPWIRERVEDGRLALHGWYFDLETGDLFWLDQASGAFSAV
ncbi:MAG: carbonic anhydrase [Rhodospirillales bacterium]|nr:carbonic anhydrase [Rhodospirillales bacterium]